MNLDGSGGWISNLNIAGNVIGLLVYLFQEIFPWMLTQKGHLLCRYAISLLRNGIST